jgi:hypothetical protein
MSVSKMTIGTPVYALSCVPGSSSFEHEVSIKKPQKRVAASTHFINLLIISILIITIYC